MKNRLKNKKPLTNYILGKYTQNIYRLGAFIKKLMNIFSINQVRTGIIKDLSVTHLNCQTDICLPVGDIKYPDIDTIDTHSYLNFFGHFRV